MTSASCEDPTLPHRPLETKATQKRKFEDSISAHSEEPEHVRLKALALREANASRQIASDPDGRLFHAAREKAIAARRADNLLRKSADAGESSLFEAPRKVVERLPRVRVRVKAVQSFVLVLVILLLAAVATLLASTWYPALHRAMVGH